MNNRVVFTSTNLSGVVTLLFLQVVLYQNKSICKIEKQKKRLQIENLLYKEPIVTFIFRILQYEFTISDIQFYGTVFAITSTINSVNANKRHS